MAQTRIPDGMGMDIDEPVLYNEFQMRFMRARRKRFCLNCKTMGDMDENSLFTCRKCQKVHNGQFGNLTAPRAFNNFLLLSGRGGGKTLIGALGAREEMMVPQSIGWVMGPSYKILHDSTFPTLVRRMHPSWVHHWDSEHMEIVLKNGALVAFRSLEDPERARGPHGVGWMWFDEAAQSPERAWHVGTPMLIKAGGIAIATTTVLGYDWTYDVLEKKALVYKEPGYWAAKWWTEQNPMFAANPVMMQKIEQARRSMPPDLFAQEYRAERRNAEGLIYGQIVEDRVLRDDDAVRKFIPEWPDIHPSRKVLIGLDSGADHPFGAVLAVVTEHGIVVVREYLERNKAISQAHSDIYNKLGLFPFGDKTFSANKNEANLRLEWGLLGTGVVPAENKHEVGIQRVQTWLHSGKLRFAYTVPRTIEQMTSYRYAVNVKPDGQKTDKERVFKLKDELPDAVRYLLMAWPELPDPAEAPISDREAGRLAAFSERTRWELQKMQEYNKNRGNDAAVLTPADKGWPVGDFFDNSQEVVNGNDDFWGGGAY